MVNVPELRKELEHITAHPEEWTQGSWILSTSRTACGTMGCLAGNAALHNGWAPCDERGRKAKLPHLRFTGTEHFEFVVRDGNVRTVPYAAREVFGLTSNEANVLFNANNKLIDLWQFAELLTDGELRTPPDVVEEYERDRAATFQVSTAVRREINESTLTRVRRNN
jgi:hypothetical protein